MARRDLSGAVDFTVLDRMTGGDDAISEEVLELFVQQAGLWSPMLDSRAEGWRDAVHTIKGAARGIGAFHLGDACALAEAEGAGGLDAVRNAMDAALGDVAAYAHERALQSLRTPRS